MLVYERCECFIMQILLFVSCVHVHAVAVLNAAFCMTCSLLKLVEENKRRPYGRGILRR